MGGLLQWWCFVIFEEDFVQRIYRHGWCTWRVLMNILVRFGICKGIRKHISYLLVWNFMSFVGCLGNKSYCHENCCYGECRHVECRHKKCRHRNVAMKKFVSTSGVKKNFKRMKWKLNVDFAWGGCCKNLYKCKISYVLLLSSFCLLITWFVIFLRYLEVFLDIFASSASLTSLWLGTEVWSIMRCCWSRCWHHLEIRLEVNQEIPVWCVAL